MNILEIFTNSILLIITLDNELWDIILLSLFVSFTALIIASLLGFILGYYFAFFLFGALFFRLENNGRNFIEKISKKQKFFYWIPIISFFACLIIDENKTYLLGELFNFIYTWSSAIVLVLIFYKFINKPNSKIRYLSNASYYIYIIHIPFIILFQGIFSSLEIHHSVKFIMIIILTTGISLITYHYFVRNTFIGILLNGKKSKEQIGV